MENIDRKDGVTYSLTPSRWAKISPDCQITFSAHNTKQNSTSRCLLDTKVFVKTFQHKHVPPPPHAAGRPTGKISHPHNCPFGRQISQADIVYFGRLNRST